MKLAPLSAFMLLVLVASAWAASASEVYPEATGLSLAVPFGSAVLAVPWGWGQLVLLEPDESPEQFPMEWSGSRLCSAPAVCGGVFAVCLERDGQRFMLRYSDESGPVEYGPYLECGAPAFDGEGSVWFTADGYLVEDGVPTGTRLDSHTISMDPTGAMVVYCDGEDRLCLMDPRTGESTVLASSSRFYGPRFISSEECLMILSPTLEGAVHLISAEGRDTPLVLGTHPFWWEDKGLLLYSVTEDDGHEITSSDIWACRPGRAEYRLTSSPGVNEIMPFVQGGTLMAIDAETGSLLSLPWH